ncbi:MAG TPA: methionine--tRNA ligase [Thermoplasmata archaeon]|nr:methionine--tRNA ligase [Thermoplasmata archaeon]
MVRILIGIAWPYANGPFHIGHLAGAYLPGDIFARYHRLRGNEVLLVSGSDMHGTPVLVTAEAEGATPREVAERNDAINREAFRGLGVSFDLFTSTHTPVHERTVHEVFLGLLRNGYIDRRTEQYAYCPKHARFLPDRYLNGICPHCGSPKARGDECDNCGRVLEPKDLGQPSCALCGTPAEFRPSEHFFLRLDLLADGIGTFLSDKSYWRPNVVAFTRNFLSGGLRPTPITRDLDWGVSIPLDGYPTKRFYVWFEAVVGYLSASREWAIRSGDPAAWRRFWDSGEPVRAYYFVGKDNIYYHTIFWPAMLQGVGGYVLPHDVPANEWMVMGGGKLSKSRSPGADVSIAAMLSEYPADAIRFYAALLAPQNHDTEFQWEEFHQVREQVLANQWGNLVQRLLVLARDRFGGRIPSPPSGWARDGSALDVRLRAAHLAITEDLEAVRLKEALERILTEVREANRRFHDAEPWKLSGPELGRVLYEEIWFVRTAAAWLAPFLPHSSESVFRMLGAPGLPGPGEWDHATDPPVAGTPFGEIRPLFPRSTTAPRAPTETATKHVPTATPPALHEPAGEEFALDLRVGKIVRVEAHPSADRLYQLEVDLGPHGRRTVVAGLRPYLPPEALQDRRVVLLANLEPRTIRSVASHGMILAAESGGTVEPLAPPESGELGTSAVGVSSPERVVKIDEFERAAFRVARVLGPGTSGRSRVSVGSSEHEVAGEWATGQNVVVRALPGGGAELAVVSYGPGAPISVGAAIAPGAKVR